ncbi:MAG: alpha-galactosidase [Cellvibrionaceae bacterium]|nr:alpha-galactosidase [Cellvibrionaceae bacterium]|tara:strand:+ start:609 stop:2738 length:2130 start_codon:yes stop_codon:yes gene_type:complete
MPDYVILENSSTQCVVDCIESQPTLLYWGNHLGNIHVDSLRRMSRRQEAPACAAEEAAISLCPTLGSGFLGKPALELCGENQPWSLNFELQQIERPTPESVIFISRDQHQQLELRHSLQLNDAGVLCASTQLTNHSPHTITVNHCAALCLKLPAQLTEVLSFEGRWAKEFQTQTTPLFSGTFSRENRHGRTSHHSFPGVILQGAHCSENHGIAYGFHLGWSGNHHTHIETLADGRIAAQMGELLLPGELQLNRNESYTSPTLYGAFSESGRNRLRQQFHAHVRHHILSSHLPQKPRPVHFNTWEAQYFDHDIDKLKRLARAAAEVGAERFVLDDGWFLGRRHDRAGLGDWIVDREIYPDGLSPIIEQVEQLGMEFGLWLEPEMVNPDSQLYRQHPDWVLQCETAPTVLARHQLVLNLSLPEVQYYLFDAIDALLRQYPIAYLKWDMNRDLHQPGDQQARSSVHRQTHALYQLLDRLRHAHPQVEIETCASGGGRADYEILSRTDRVWTSDSNDALDRLAIQKGFSLFFPAEVMGAHVGPHRCHITGRQLPMETRAAVALFGHMGMEVNLLEESAEDQQTLRLAIALHKQHRALIHSGNLVRLATLNKADAFGIVAKDQSQALFSFTLLDSQNSTLPSTLLFDGLDNNANYEIALCWPPKPSSSTPSILEELTDSAQPLRTSGAALMKHGLQLPLLHPHSVLIFHLQLQQ